MGHIELVRAQFMRSSTLAMTKSAVEDFAGKVVVVFVAGTEACAAEEVDRETRSKGSRRDAREAAARG